MAIQKLKLIKVSNLKAILKLEGITRMDTSALTELVASLELWLLQKTPLMKQHMLISGRRTLKKEDILKAFRVHVS